MSDGDQKSQVVAKGPRTAAKALQKELEQKSAEMTAVRAQNAQLISQVSELRVQRDSALAGLAELRSAIGVWLSLAAVAACIAVLSGGKFRLK